MKMVSIGSGGPGNEVGGNNFQMGIWMSFRKILFRRARVTVDEISRACEMELNSSILGS